MTLVYVFVIAFGLGAVCGLGWALRQLRKDWEVEDE